MKGEFPAMRFSPALLPFSRPKVADNFPKKTDHGVASSNPACSAKRQLRARATEPKPVLSFSDIEAKPYLLPRLFSAEHGVTNHQQFAHASAQLRSTFDVAEHRPSIWRTKRTSESRSRAESQANKFSPAWMLVAWPNSASNWGRIPYITLVALEVRIHSAPPLSLRESTLSHSMR